MSHEPPSDPLRTLFYDFIGQLLQVLEEIFKARGGVGTNGLPQEEIIVGLERTTNPAFGGIPFHLKKYTSIPSYRAFVEHNFEFAITKAGVSESYRKLSQQLSLDPMLTVGAGGGGNMLILPALRSLAARIVDEQQSFSFKEEVIAHASASVQAYLDSPGLFYLYLHSLKSFELPQGLDRLDLDATHRIRRATEADRQFFTRDPAKATLESLDQLEAAWFDPLLEIEVTFNKGPQAIDVDRFEQEADKMLLALRLFKGGAVGSQPLFYYSPMVLAPIPFSSVGWHNANYGETTYELTQEDVNKLQTFWQEFREIEPLIDSKLEVAQERFMTSYSQRQPLNRLLDLVIGLESLFSEGPESILFKFTLRAAVVTGLSLQDRFEISDKLKLAYAIRSTIAHGSDNLSSQAKRLLKSENVIELEEFIEFVRRVLARAILFYSRWLKSNSDKAAKQFLQELDRAMLATNGISFWSL